MSRQMIALIILVLASIAVTFVGLTSTAPATLEVAGQPATLTVGTILLIGYGVGALATLGLAIANWKNVEASSKQLGQWQVQDAKLAAEVRTDREKQLEAKVATLEAALDRALKK